MDLDDIDWSALERLRAAFLDGTAGAADYWQSEADLRSYDQTFARRIAWKWQHVLSELQRLNWVPPDGAVMDWGCGTGVASREFVRAFGRLDSTPAILWDRSRLALQFASGQLQKEAPGLEVRTEVRAAPETLLLSHVITELSEVQLSQLVEMARQVSAIIWIEPGTHDASRKLISARERLLDEFNVVSPCTHKTACGMLSPGNERHWCHHFASPPPEVFTDSNWVRFGKLAGIDLRSLPLSYLVLDRRKVAPLPEDSVRVIGRPRVYKAYAMACACRPEGVGEFRISKRQLPERFKECRKGTGDSLECWRIDSEEVMETRPVV